MLIDYFLLHYWKDPMYLLLTILALLRFHHLSWKERDWVMEKKEAVQTSLLLVGHRWGSLYPLSNYISDRFDLLHHSSKMLLFRMMLQVERTIQYIKDRTECFDDYFPCRKKNCKLKHVINWLNMFVGYHNSELKIVN